MTKLSEESLYKLALNYIEAGDKQSNDYLDKMLEANVLDYSKNNYEIVSACCYYDHVDLLKKLFEKQVNIVLNAERDLGICIQRNSKESLKFLLSKLTTLSSFDQVNLAKLTIQARDFSLFQILIDHGLDISADSNNALLFATYLIEKDFVKWIIENTNADINTDDFYVILSFSKVGDVDFMKYLISKNADTKAFNDAPLLTAAQYGNLDLVKYFVENNLSIYDHTTIPLAINKAKEADFTEVINYLQSKLI